MSIPFSVDSLGKSTPAWLCDLNSSLWNILEGAHFITEYLPGDSKLVVHTDRLDDEKSEAVSDLLERVLPQNIEVVQYNHNMEISWKDINKYAECVTREDFEAVYGARDFWNDVTSEGEWLYDTPNANATSLLSATDEEYDKLYGTKLLKAIINAPSLVDAYELVKRQDKLQEIDAYMPEATSINRMCWICRNLKKAKIYAPKAKDGYYAFAACYNAPIHEIDIELPSLNSADGFAFSAKFSKASVLKLLASLPSYESGTHRITLGIHVDYKNDTDVLAAISAAEEKGWTLTVQWNGTPTSGISTMDLEEIWCKVTENEHGEYTDENGNRCTLDWGHYVTDTSAYELFFSLMEAEQYFKLTKVNENE